MNTRTQALHRTQVMPSAPASRLGSPVRPLICLVLVGLDMLAVCVYLGRRDFLLAPVSIYLALYTLLFGLWAYALLRIIPAIAPGRERQALVVVLTFAALCRFALVPAPPSITTDMYRYVWDGRLILHGINPYRWSPLAEGLRSLRDPIWEQMEYKPYNTIYMPVSQAVFALCGALFRNSISGFKAVYVLFDLGVIALLLDQLRRLGRPALAITLYAWCPLALTEIGLAGHQDVVGVFFLLLTFRLVSGKRGMNWAAVTLVASVLTKGFALVLLPLFCRTFGRRFAAVAAGAFLYLGMPLWVYLPDFLHGMRQYLDNVNVNSGLFHGVDLMLTPLTRFHYEVTRALSNGAIVGAVGWSAITPAVDIRDLMRRAFIVLAVTLLVVPTLFPWYLLWILPLCVLLGNRPSYAFMLLSGLSVLLYTYYFSLHSYWWTPLAEYVPFYAALAWEYFWRRRGASPPRAPLAGTWNVANAHSHQDWV